MENKSPKKVQKLKAAHTVGGNVIRSCRVDDSTVVPTRFQRIPTRSDNPTFDAHLKDLKPETQTGVRAPRQSITGRKCKRGCPRYFLLPWQLTKEGIYSGFADLASESMTTWWGGWLHDVGAVAKSSHLVP